MAEGASGSPAKPGPGDTLDESMGSGPDAATTLRGEPLPAAVKTVLSKPPAPDEVKTTLSRPPEPEVSVSVIRSTVEKQPSSRPSQAMKKSEPPPPRAGSVRAGGSEDLTPTLRPEPAKPSPFAGLLAEAAKEEAGSGAAPTGERSEKRKKQDTLKIPGRGKTTADAESQPSSPPKPASASSDELETRPPSPTIDAAAQSWRRLGAYKIIGELGSGGMAVVYKAAQPALDRLVAIKELRAEYVHDPQIAQRFEREATSLATLQHGNIVHIYDFIKDFETSYIVMEYVEGIDLFDLLADVSRLPPDVAGLVALQVAEGLEYAHYRGIIHRDIKPSNVLVSKTGEVKIMDFGIARDPGRMDLTQVGMALGTPAYMAPEQILGEKIDFRADIFALGICLFEMLTGEKPWPEEEGRSVSRRVLDEPHRPPRSLVPDLPVELERVIERCLAKDPAKRYASTHELRRAIEAYVSEHVTVDPRKRLVVFLKNRRILSDAEASGSVEQELLRDPALRRADLGLPVPPADDLMRPVAIAHGVALLAIAAAALIAALTPFGDRLPKERPIPAVVRPVP